MPKYTLKVNGKPRAVEADADTPLLYVLRENLALKGPRFGCGLGQCGACTVHLNGEAVRSCLLRVDAIRGGAITTLEGLGSTANPSKLQQAFIDEQAAQCGFCLNGVILTAKAFLDQNPAPSDAQLQQALSTVLCRCFTHTRMLRAITRYASSRRSAGAEARKIEGNA